MRKLGIYVSSVTCVFTGRAPFLGDEKWRLKTKNQRRRTGARVGDASTHRRVGYHTR